MKFGVTLPAFDALSDIHRLVQLAVDAEAAGWDGFFLWDHVVNNAYHMLDPYIAIAAIAAHTQQIKLGVMVTAVARRRPWKLAREMVTLDHLSNGRLIFGAALGSPEDYGIFGEDEDNRTRAQKLDEGLDILTGLWTGETFSYHGTHYQLDPVQFLPKPQQQPRIPVWIGGGWDKLNPLKRAVKYDGYFPLKFGDNLSIDEWQGIREDINQHRTSDTPFDLIHGGYLPDEPDAAAEMVAPYAEFGIDWWIENIEPFRYGLGWDKPIPLNMIEDMEMRIRRGAPKI